MLQALTHTHVLTTLTHSLAYSVKRSNCCREWEKEEREGAILVLALALALAFMKWNN